MITDALLWVIYGVVWLALSPLRLLPDVELPAQMTTTIYEISGYLSSVNFIIPTTTLITIIGVILAFEAVIFTYKLIMWVINKIPTIN